MNQNKYSPFLNKCSKHSAQTVSTLKVVSLSSFNKHLPLKKKKCTSAILSNYTHTHAYIIYNIYIHFHFFSEERKTTKKVTRHNQCWAEKVIMLFFCFVFFSPAFSGVRTSINIEIQQKALECKFPKK